MRLLPTRGVLSVGWRTMAALHSRRERLTCARGFLQKGKAIGCRLHFVKTLLLMRHAKSSWQDSELPDHERPLNGRGRRSAPFMGELLRAEIGAPDWILTSTAKRALETAQAVVSASGYEGPLTITRRLYLAEPVTYLDVLSEIPEDRVRVLVIGHNPGISELLTQLTGETREMPTAALAAIEIPDAGFTSLSEVRGARLLGFWRPPRDDKKSRA